MVCVGVAAVLFFTAHIPQSRLALLLWLDAIGLALFAVTGAEKALLAGAGPVVVVTMGVMTATFGGILRDILGGETPVILSREIYVSAALLGALVFVACLALGLAHPIALVSVLPRIGVARRRPALGLVPAALSFAAAARALTAIGLLLLDRQRVQELLQAVRHWRRRRSIAEHLA